MSEKKKYVNILNEQVALALCNAGFLYIRQPVCNGQSAYAFELTPDLETALQELYRTGNYGEAVYVIDEYLRFGTGGKNA